MLSDATVPIDTGPIVCAEIRDLERRFGVVAWFGFHTRRWWAVVEGRLVEAATPASLADAVMAVLGADVRRYQTARPSGEPRRPRRPVRPVRRRVRPPSRHRRARLGLDAPELTTDREGRTR
jgi:hypothetical protein